MVTEPQKNALQRSARNAVEGLNNEQLKKVYFLIDDIIQYGCLSASMIIHKELNGLLRKQN